MDCTPADLTVNWSRVLVTREVGMAAIRESQRRNALPEDDALELGVRAVHEGRRQTA